MKASHILFNQPLLQNGLDWAWVLSILLGLFSLSLGYKYTQYQSFLSKRPIVLNAQVLLQYAKGQQPYHVLKLKDSHSNVFYTTSKEDIKDLTHAYVQAYGKMATCSFWEFLKSCYFHTFRLSLSPLKSYKNQLRLEIDKQHHSPRMGNFYRTLFLADPLDKRTRQVSVGLGLSHIIAISGFHLGILSAFFYFVLRFPYQFLQQRYFPYRNRAYDLGVLILLLVFGYLILLDFQPSFLRAFVMAMGAFIIFYSGLELVSFSLLALATLTSLAFFPALIRNVGFILSVSGVFYIFLFIKYTPRMPSLCYALLLNSVIFLHMLLVVHAFFAPFSLYQMSGILTAFVFLLFFPLSLILHVCGLGDLFDPYLLRALDFKVPMLDYTTPLWLLGLYLGISLLAIRYKLAYFGVYALSLSTFAYLAGRAVY